MHFPTLGLVLMFGSAAQIGGALLYATSATSVPDAFVPSVGVTSSTMLVIGFAVYLGAVIGNVVEPRSR